MSKKRVLEEIIDLDTPLGREGAGSSTASLPMDLDEVKPTKRYYRRNYGLVAAAAASVLRRRYARRRFYSYRTYRKPIRYRRVIRRYRRYRRYY